MKFDYSCSDGCINHIEELVNQMKLKKYISGYTKAYTQWSSGDIGVANMIYDTTKNIFKISSFSNQTARKRNKNLRENPDNFKSNSRLNNKYESENYFNNEYYNDSLDLDQQDGEFWDSL